VLGRGSIMSEEINLGGFHEQISNPSPDLHDREKSTATPPHRKNRRSSGGIGKPNELPPPKSPAEKNLKILWNHREGLVELGFGLRGNAATCLGSLSKSSGRVRRVGGGGRRSWACRRRAGRAAGHRAIVLYHVQTKLIQQSPSISFHYSIKMSD
jgi:hypothetical protein